jgi:hypothetical protein
MQDEGHPETIYLARFFVILIDSTVTFIKPQSSTDAILLTNDHGPQ